jgi:hypothetical protein
MSYIDKMHRWGRIWAVVTAGFIFGFPFALESLLFCLPSLVLDFLLWVSRYIGVSLCVYNIAQFFALFKLECFTKADTCLCLKYRKYFA